MGLPSEVTAFRLVGIDALNCKVRLDILKILVLVEPDLHAAGARAGSLHAVLVEIDLHDVPRA